MRLSFRSLLLMLVGISLLLPGCAPGNAPPSPTPGPTATSDPNSTPEFENIRAEIARLWTSAAAAPTPASSPTAQAYEEQYTHDFEALKSSLSGKKVQSWEGWVVGVKDDKDDGPYLVSIDMDELYDRNPFLVFEYRGVRRAGLADVVLTGVNSDQAEKVSPGQKVLLSGTINDLKGFDSEVLPVDPANARLAVVLKESTIMPVTSSTGNAGAEIDPNESVITLTRPVCGMMSVRCYTYELFVYGDGRVVYTEEDWDTIDQGGQAITKTYQVSEGKVAELVAAFERINYFSLQDNYESYDWSDAPSATTSITTPTRRKSIFHYHGDTSAPAELGELENKIAEVVASDQPTATPLPSPKLKWKVTPGFRIETSPSYFGDLIYLTSEDTCLCALDLNTGATKLSSSLNGTVATSPVVVDGVVLFASADTLALSPEITHAGYVYALNAQTGEERWHFKTDDEEVTSIVASDGEAYFGAGQWSGRIGGYRDQPQGHLYALKIATGDLEWKLPIPDADIWEAPAIADGVLYFTDRTKPQTRNSYIYAIDAKTREEKWRFTIQEFGTASSPVVADRVVYFSTNNEFYAVESMTGRKKWHFQTEFSWFSQPTIVNGTVYVGVNTPGVPEKKHRPEENINKYILAMDAGTGQERWRYITEDGVTSAPSISGGTLYFGGSDGLYAVQADTGQGKWRFPTESFVSGSPIVVGDTVYFGDFDGNFYAVQAP